MSSLSPTPLQKQLSTEASKAQSACEFLGEPVGGYGGGEFADPCNENTKIDKIEIGMGEFDGLPKALLYIKTTYR